jgi:unsaturated rhamnogalacturonyl hydrolase
LVLMANDTSNCEIPHFNTLAKEFGIEFSNKNRNFVKNDVFSQGQFLLSGKHPIFKEIKKIYIKEISVLNIKAPAEAVLSAPEGSDDASGKTGDTIMAVAKYGKGRVFAVGDPWLYTEYIGGRRLSNDFENYKAAKYLAEWLLKY